MATTKTSFGKTKEGKEAFLYMMENENGMKVAVTDFGASLVSVWVPDKDGNLKDVVLGYDDVTGYEIHGGHLGAVVGRNANRIGDASFVLSGKKYQLAKNSKERHNLHSGPDYYGQRLWEAEEEETEIGPSVVFSLLSPDGDQGFPGTAQITVTYTLSNDNSLILRYEGICDADTIFNMTNHSYFNMNGAGSGDVLSQYVWIDSDYLTEADEDSIPHGNLMAVEHTPFDFRKEKRIGEEIDTDHWQIRIGDGYDHNWVLKNNFRLEEVASLRSEDTKIKMHVYTDLPGVQVYTANSLDVSGGKKNAYYGRRSGICFETQYFPNSQNVDSFASPVFKAGEEYKTTTVYRFETESC